MSETTTKRRVPSARVIAAKLVCDMLESAVQGRLTTEQLTAMFTSPVNIKKRSKVVEQFNKMTKKFIDRHRNIVDKFHNPPARDPEKVKAASDRMRNARKGTSKE